MRCPAKLIGGRYDGDQGTIHNTTAVPEFLWAYDCADRDCPHGGIHWTTFEARAQEMPTAELYRHSHFDGHDAGLDMPVAVYVAAPDETPMDVLLRPDVAHV